MTTQTNNTLFISQFDMEDTDYRVFLILNHNMLGSSPEEEKRQIYKEFKLKQLLFK